VLNRFIRVCACFPKAKAENAIFAIMQILVLSDIHIEFAAYEPANVAADVVILAGDIDIGIKGVRWAKANFPDRPVIYVPGNHEYYNHAIPELTAKLIEEARGSNVQVLENESFEIDGVLFLGCTLWTNLEFEVHNPLYGAVVASHSMSDFRMIRNSLKRRLLTPADTLKFHKKSFQWLWQSITDNDQPKVVVTHHAPSPRSIHPKYRGCEENVGFASDLTSFIERTQPMLWVHGHMHDSCEYTVGATAVVCNPRGYPDERGNGFDAEKVVEV
jgi:hypothetical protein